MTDINDDAALTPDNSKDSESSDKSNASKPPDRAASELKSSVVTGAHDLTDGAKHLAGDAVAKTRESAQTQISGGKDRLAEGLGSVAEAIRHTGEQLRDGEQSNLTSYVSRAADGVEAASDYLKEKSIADVLGDVGSFARREPAVFLGGAFVLGLLGGRFLKSSQRQDSTSNGASGSSQKDTGRSQRTNSAQPSRQGGPGSRSTPRGPSTSSGSKPIVGQRPYEIDAAGEDSRDDGATLLGGV